MTKALAIESGELHALEKISAARPVAATHALSLAASDVSELQAAIAAFRSRQITAFAHGWKVWVSDRRTSQAFTTLGATECA